MNRLSRRSVLVGGLAMAGLAACAQKPVRADPAEPVPPIHERIEALQLRHNARIGVYAVDFESGRTVSHLDGASRSRCVRRSRATPRPGCFRWCNAVS